MSANGKLPPRIPDGGRFVDSTLRDFFAGKAFDVFVRVPGHAPIGPLLAEDCYRFADSMIAARDKRSEPTP